MAEEEQEECLIKRQQKCIEQRQQQKSVYGHGVFEVFGNCTDRGVNSFVVV